MQKENSDNQSVYLEKDIVGEKELVQKSGPKIFFLQKEKNC